MILRRAPRRVTGTRLQVMIQSTVERSPNEHAHKAHLRTVLARRAPLAPPQTAHSSGAGDGARTRRPPQPDPHVSGPRLGPQRLQRPVFGAAEQRRSWEARSPPVSAAAPDWRQRQRQRQRRQQRRQQQQLRRCSNLIQAEFVSLRYTCRNFSIRESGALASVPPCPRGESRLARILLLLLLLPLNPKDYFESQGSRKPAITKNRSGPACPQLVTPLKRLSRLITRCRSECIARDCSAEAPCARRTLRGGWVLVAVVPLAAAAAACPLLQGPRFTPWL